MKQFFKYLLLSLLLITSIFQNVDAQILGDKRIDVNGGGSGFPQPFSHFKLEASGVDETGLNDATTETNTSYVAGLIGDCVSYTNTTSAGFIIGSNKMNFNDGAGNDLPFTINTWLNLNTLAATTVPFSKRANTSTSANWICILRSTTVVEFILYSIDGTLISNFSNPALVGGWVMLTLTYDGSETKEGMEIYINSVNESNTLNDTGYSGMTSTSAQTILGALRNTLTLPIRGKQDEVSFFEVELTQAQITELFDGGNGKTYPF